MHLLISQSHLGQSGPRSRSSRPGCTMGSPADPRRASMWTGPAPSNGNTTWGDTGPHGRLARDARSPHPQAGTPISSERPSWGQLVPRRRNRASVDPATGAASEPATRTPNPAGEATAFLPRRRQGDSVHDQRHAGSNLQRCGRGWLPSLVMDGLGHARAGSPANTISLLTNRIAREVRHVRAPRRNAGCTTETAGTRDVVNLNTAQLADHTRRSVITVAGIRTSSTSEEG